MEFLFPEAPGRKIPQNFYSWKLRDEKFHRIFIYGSSGMKNTRSISVSEAFETKDTLIRQQKQDVFYKITTVRCESEKHNKKI
jgi:hypothetical protein